MSKAKRLETAMNEGFRERLAEAFKKKFGLEIVTSFNIFAMNVVSVRADGEPMTEEHHDFIRAYERGFIDAWEITTDHLERKGR